MDAGVLAHDVVDEVGADEAAAAGDDDALRLEDIKPTPSSQSG